jgi:hypothetical protein
VLRWDDADLDERGTLRVGGQLVRVGAGHTRASARMMKQDQARHCRSTNSRTAVYSGAHRMSTEQRVERAGMYEDHVSSSRPRLGHPQPREPVKRSFKPLLKRSGFRRSGSTIYGHTCARCYGAGRSSQARAGASRACRHSNDPGYLLAQSSFDGKLGFRGCGRRAGRSAGCSTVAVEGPYLSIEPSCVTAFSA